MKLKDVAEIYSGQGLRGDAKKNCSDGYQVIQMGDLEAEGSIAWGRLQRMHFDTVRDFRFVQNGDILFQAKGQINFAVSLGKVKPEVIAGAPLYIIRIKNTRNILPEYVSWFINQKPAQQHLKRISAGTGIPLINTKNLSSLEIDLPKTAIQLKIIKIHKLSVKEKQLHKRLQGKRQQLTEALLLEQLRQSMEKINVG